MKLSLLIAGAVFGLSRVVLSNVIVVAPSGGDFTQLQPAVDAAIDGDTILVKTGSYATFSVVDKALSIVGDTGADVQITGAVRARNLAAGKTLVIANVKATGVFTQPGLPQTNFGLILTNDLGHVRVERCQFTGSGVSPYHDGIRIQSCVDVSLTSCIAHGGVGANGSGDGARGGNGLQASSSNITCYDSQLFGGAGQAGPADGGAGGDGCLASACELFASGTSFIGGNGGMAGDGGSCFNVTDGGPGGNGTSLDGLARILDCVEQAGSGGPKHPDACFSFPGQNGFPRIGGTFEDLAGPARHLASPTPVREMTTATLDFTGVPGEQVTLLLARTTDRVYVDGESGVELVGSPMRLIAMGVVPPSGVLTKQLSIFSLGSVPAVRVYLQSLFTDPQLNSVLSGPSSLVVLNQLY